MFMKGIEKSAGGGRKAVVRLADHAQRFCATDYDRSGSLSACVTGPVPGLRMEEWQRPTPPSPSLSRLTYT